MKAEELMIGDWVLVDRYHQMRITKLSQYGEYPDCEPIPLTPEILEKNGFVPDNFSPYYLPIEDGSVRFSKHQYGLYCNILRPYQRYDGVCNYVHQLQHALRLCGVEKEIVL